MSELGITKEQLLCGLLRVEPAVFKAQFSDLVQAIKRYASRQERFEVLKINHREYAGDLFYHAFQANPAINYEHMFFSRIAPGSSKQWEQWLEEEFKASAFESRYLTAVWKLDCDWKLNLSLELSRNLKHDELKGTSEPAIFRVEAEFNALGLAEPNEEVVKQRQEQASSAREALTNSLSAQFREPGHRDYRGMPKDLTTIDYPLEQASRLFREAVACGTSLFGDATNFRFWMVSDRLAIKLQESNDIDSRVWSKIRFYGRVKKNVDVFAQPADRTHVYPYVVLTAVVDSQFLFQITVVHAGGQTLFECQAIDPIWFDWVSNFFQAPIDVWQGPIAARFGWYGNAELGIIVRHPTDPNRKLDKKAAEKLPTQPYYLVFPVGIDHFGDSYVINDARYEDPAHIFKSRAEAEAYAAEQSYWLLGWTVPGFTSHIASFDLLKLPTCDEICQLLHIEDRSNWREALNNYVPSSLSTSDQNRLIQLLGLKSYRIVELHLDPRNYNRIGRTIHGPGFSERGRAWLAKKCSMEILDEEE